jgi:hypothetical protein
MFNNLVKNLHYNISKSTVIRDKPTFIYVSTFDKVFKPFKVVENVEKYIPTSMRKIYPVEAQVDCVYYTYIDNALKIPIQEHYIDKSIYSLDYLSKKSSVFASILDISYLDYPFKIFKLPTYDDEYIKFISEKHVHEVYKEFENLEKYFKIKDRVDGYKITDTAYIFFDNDNKFIDETELQKPK